MHIQGCRGRDFKLKNKKRECEREGESEWGGQCACETFIQTNKQWPTFPNDLANLFVEVKLV